MEQPWEFNRLKSRILVNSSEFKGPRSYLFMDGFLFPFSTSDDFEGFCLTKYSHELFIHK